MPDDLEPAEPIVPRDSSTVIVLREAAAALEVFMLERHIKSDFAGGAYVFPGGTVDEADLERALAVCAIRETFEEAGILLARHDDGSPVQLDDPRWRDRRTALANREID